MIHASRTITGTTGKGYVSFPTQVTAAEYGNLVLGLTADFPIQNVGTTSATWLDWSSQKNDGVQTVIDSQPTRVLDGDKWVLDFDGTDDYIETPVLLTSGSKVTVDLEVNSTTVQVFFGFRGAANGNWFYLGISGSDWLYRYGDVTGLAANVAGAGLGRFELTMSEEGLWVNDTQVYENTTKTWAGSGLMYIGAMNENGTAGAFTDANIYSVVVEDE